MLAMLCAIDVELISGIEWINSGDYVTVCTALANTATRRTILGQTEPDWRPKSSFISIRKTYF